MRELKIKLKYNLDKFEKLNKFDPDRIGDKPVIIRNEYHEYVRKNMIKLHNTWRNNNSDQ